MSKVKQINTSDAPDMRIDERPSLIFVHSIVDDMTDLTPNDMRVFMHLARRTNKSTGNAWPSYQSIGDHCFSSVSDNRATRKSFARKSVDNLIKAGLIEKIHAMRDNGSQDSNRYVLIDPRLNKHTPVLNRHTPVPIKHQRISSQGNQKKNASLAGDKPLPPPFLEQDSANAAAHTEEANDASLSEKLNNDQAMTETEIRNAAREIRKAYRCVVREMGDEPIASEGEINFWARRIAIKGFTPAQVVYAYRYMKKDGGGYWEEEDIPLGSVAKQIGAIIGAAQRREIEKMQRMEQLERMKVFI